MSETNKQKKKKKKKIGKETNKVYLGAYHGQVPL